MHAYFHRPRTNGGVCKRTSRMLYVALLFCAAADCLNGPPLLSKVVLYSTTKRGGWAVIAAIYLTMRVDAGLQQVGGKDQVGGAGVQNSAGSRWLWFTYDTTLACVLFCSFFTGDLILDLFCLWPRGAERILSLSTYIPKCARVRAVGVR